VKTVADRYDHLAERYEARWGHYVRASTRETLARMELRPGLQILDIGCGTGALLREIVRRAPGVRSVGIDLSPRMLGVARSTLLSGAELLRADVHRLPFTLAAFDLVVSASSFHYWEQPGLALEEIARVLRPGGELIITDWCDDFWACRLCDRLLRLVGRERRRIYGSRECEELLARMGYEPQTIDRYKIDWFWGLMTARAVRPAAIGVASRSHAN
jgi:ubiquinone/menaquinone biosynthesis C-methylase UbiE